MCLCSYSVSVFCNQSSCLICFYLNENEDIIIVAQLVTIIRNKILKNEHLTEDVVSSPCVIRCVCDHKYYHACSLKCITGDFIIFH